MSSSVKSPPAINTIRIAIAAIFALIAFAPSDAFAAITCTFTSVPGVAFGNYDDSSATPTDGTSLVTVSCSRAGGPNSVTLTVSIGTSANTGLVSSRAMKNTASAVLLNYNLYRDTARTQVWGVTAGTNTVSATLTGIPNGGSQSTSLNIYGRIAALQNATVGNYADSVAITVSP
jgi:spore coat protein U-like protein